jgi:hypothetical protein
MIATVESSLTVHSYRLKKSLITKGRHALATFDTTNAVATPGIAATCLHLSLTSVARSQYGKKKLTVRASAITTTTCSRPALEKSEGIGLP